ncbi:hypothetical protein QE152_g31516 [Popillia japonica]|uniref:Uncharacterized protein n=1 Tax=Popillia japonica TaxID=7064 RepID=A0AAW1J0R9_POPJA
MCKLTPVSQRDKQRFSISICNNSGIGVPTLVACRPAGCGYDEIQDSMGSCSKTLREKQQSVGTPTSAFRATGVYPLNPGAIPDSAFGGNTEPPNVHDNHDPTTATVAEVSDPAPSAYINATQLMI